MSARKNGKAAPKCVGDNTNFWKETEQIMFDEYMWQIAPKEIESAISLMGISAGAKILDLCCGQGRHSLELAKRGFAVTGVDFTAQYLEKAHAKAKAQKLNAEFVNSDMREFCRKCSFDAAINMFTSFGYFEDQKDDEKVVRNLYDSLKPGGVLLMHMTSKEILARIFRERDWYEAGGMKVLEERAVSQNWGWMKTRWIMSKNGKEKEVKSEHRLYSGTELEALLRKCGFADVKIFGDLAGAPYDQNAKVLVAVARK
ncbi:MAG: class I SAM-dependent methyltransferase [Candidatus Thermoplasmatota archaeon]|nr:class I SAM-dependent methyltransferase [Candidatus Thermoplasmatota archaeon]